MLMAFTAAAKYDLPFDGLHSPRGIQHLAAFQLEPLLESAFYTTIAILALHADWLFTATAALTRPS
jgi:hypothetical protein